MCMCVRACVCERARARLRAFTFIYSPGVWQFFFDERVYQKSDNCNQQSTRDIKLVYNNGSAFDERKKPRTTKTNIKSFSINGATHSIVAFNYPRINILATNVYLVVVVVVVVVLLATIIIIIIIMMARRPVIPLHHPVSVCYNIN